MRRIAWIDDTSASWAAKLRALERPWVELPAGMEALLGALHRAGYDADFTLGGLTGSRGPGFATLNLGREGLHVEVDGERLRVSVRRDHAIVDSFLDEGPCPSPRLLACLDAILDRLSGPG